MITEKMEIEKKGKDKFTLDEERNQSLVLLPIMFFRTWNFSYKKNSHC